MLRAIAARVNVKGEMRRIVGLMKDDMNGSRSLELTSEISHFLRRLSLRLMTAEFLSVEQYESESPLNQSTGEYSYIVDSRLGMRRVVSNYHLFETNRNICYLLSFRATRKISRNEINQLEKELDPKRISKVKFVSYYPEEDLVIVKFDNLELLRLQDRLIDQLLKLIDNPGGAIRSIN